MKSVNAARASEIGCRFFFFQAEDGIRDVAVTGVQTCALPILAEAAHDARAAGEPTELAESDLTRALRAVFGQPDFRKMLNGQGSADELLAELEAAAHQVFLARKFYNDAVAATRAARRSWLVRMLGLAGGAAMPEFFEIDDSLVAAGGEGWGTDM